PHRPRDDRLDRPLAVRSASGAAAARRRAVRQAAGGAGVRVSERPQIVLAGNAAGRERAGGHLWALAQWALGLHAAGARVAVAPAATAEALRPIATFDAPPGDAGAGPAAVLNAMGFLDADACEALAPGGARVFLDLDPGYPQM